MNLTDESRNQIAGQPRADLADDSLSDFVWNIEMRGSAHGVQDVKVVGQNPRVEQPTLRRYYLVPSATTAAAGMAGGVLPLARRSA